MRKPTEGDKKETGERGRKGERARKRTPRRTAVGVNGDTALDLLWRLGSLTTPHLVSFSGISKTSAHETLQQLRENKICEQRDRKPHWFSRMGRAPAHYYLSRGNYANGILEGAAAAGLEPKGKASMKAITNRYALFGLPQHAVHVWLRNQFYAILLDRARSAELDEARLPVEKLHGESFGGFPLRIDGPSRSSSRGVHPDGRFDAAFGSREQGNYYERSYYVEAETRPRRKDAIAKINRYCGAWYALGSKLAMAGEEDRERRLVAAGFGPVIFVYPHARDAQAVREYARKHFARAAELDPFSDAGEPYADLAHHWRRTGMMLQPPGAYFVFCGIDELTSREDGVSASGDDVFRGPCYLPLEGHAEAAEEDRRIELVDVAEALWKAKHGR